jgi:hypothetical protein
MRWQCPRTNPPGRTRSSGGTDSAFAAIMEEKRRLRLEKSMRLRSMRLMQNGCTP